MRHKGNAWVSGNFRTYTWLFSHAFLHCSHSAPKRRSLISYPILTMRAMSDTNVVTKCSMKNKLLKDSYMPRCAVALIRKYFWRRKSYPLCHSQTCHQPECMHLSCGTSVRPCTLSFFPFTYQTDLPYRRKAAVVLNVRYLPLNIRPGHFLADYGLRSRWRRRL